MEAKSAKELSTLTSSELVTLMEDLRSNASDIGCKWAEAKEKYKEYKELLPHHLATITNAHLGPKVAVNYAKTKALASDNYKVRVEAMVKAEKEAIKLEVEYKAYIKSLEALSAISWVRNNELKLARG